MLNGIRFKLFTGWRPSLFCIVMVLLCHAPSVSAIQADDQCNVELRAISDPRYSISNLIGDPIPLSGEFPSDKMEEANGPVTYSIEESGVRYYDSAPKVIINDTEWVTSNSVSTVLPAAVPSLNVRELSSVMEFLGVWSRCADADIASFTSLFTDFGFGWVCSPGDPFLALQSPASRLCPGGSSSRTIGSLPLGLVDARWLSKTRVGLIVADGPDIQGMSGNPGSPALGSVWVLVQTEDGWKVDAIVGAVSIDPHWFPIAVPY